MDNQTASAYGIPQEWEDRLSFLRDLKPGWLEGEGREISRDAINRAGSFLAELYRRGTERGGVFPTEEGGVSIEWVSDDGSASVGIEFCPNGEVQMISFNGATAVDDFLFFEYSEGYSGVYESFVSHLEDVGIGLEALNAM